MKKSGDNKVNKGDYLNSLKKQVNNNFYEKFKKKQQESYNFSIAATLADFIDGKDVPLYKISDLANILNKIKDVEKEFVSQGKGLKIYYNGDIIVVEIASLLENCEERIDKITCRRENAEWQAFNKKLNCPIVLKDDKMYNTERIKYVAKYLGATLNYIKKNIALYSKV